MIIELSELFIRDLEKLKLELDAYSSESLLWTTQSEIKNSAGNLALHLVGNLNHFVGHVLCKTDYQRNREAEFADSHIPVSQIKRQIDDTILMFNARFINLDESILSDPFPIQIFQKDVSTRFMLMHLISHLSYHLGQINYHRRLINA